jgi:2-polyprenyl-3-methyl-5-hydroxy-6-metoxy-1,4-benzoquinol methylase
MQDLLRACEVCSGREFSPLFEKDLHHFEHCDSCGLERIEPQPTDETLTKIYGRHYYDAWGLQRNEETVARLKRGTFAYVLDRLPPRSDGGGKLLDCGAATGFLLELARDRGMSPYGVELSEFGAGEIARKFGAGHAFQGNLESATFPDAREGDFDAITMCDYLEHVRTPKTVLERAHTLLAPGGALALTTPDTGSLTHRLLGAGWPHYKVEHLHYFARTNLRRLLTDTGFGDVQFFPLWKALNIQYLREQFEVYPHPLLSRGARAVGRILPDALQRQPLRILTGELLAIARRH